VAWKMWERKAMLHDGCGVYLCVCGSEERIFVFSDWEVIAVSFRLETCGCSVSQNSEFFVLSDGMLKFVWDSSQ
jgi:hypothetical protein